MPLKMLTVGTKVSSQFFFYFFKYPNIYKYPSHFSHFTQKKLLKFKLSLNYSQFLISNYFFPFYSYILILLLNNSFIFLIVIYNYKYRILQVGGLELGSLGIQLHLKINFFRLKWKYGSYLCLKFPLIG